jgi:hypothetical protein
LAEDLAWAKALLMVEADECPGCGHSRAETTAIENDGAYVATLLYCHACKTREETVAASTRTDASGAGMSTGGLLASVRKRVERMRP